MLERVRGGASAGTLTGIAVAIVATCLGSPNGAIPSGSLRAEGTAGAPSKGASKKPSKEALKDLDLAVRLLNAGQLDKAIEQLQLVVKKHAGDPVAEKATALLRDRGVGDGIRVILEERTVFRESFKIPEDEVLKQAEDALEGLRPTYAEVDAFFKKASVRFLFYDSEARFKKVTGLLTAAGSFQVTKADTVKRALEGDIAWHFPRSGLNPKDRLLTIRAVLHHEAAHYLNAIHFGAVLPPVIEEAIATYLESRLVVEPYVGFRATRRELIEANARSGLNAIAKYPDFADMLDGTRGFGRGDDMIQRWYGLCYALVDFMDRGEIRGKKATVSRLFETLEETCRDQRGESQGASLPRPLENRPVIEALVKRFYRVSLQEFHAALVKHITASYKPK